MTSILEVAAFMSNWVRSGWSGKGLKQTTSWVYGWLQRSLCMFKRDNDGSYHHTEAHTEGLYCLLLLFIHHHLLWNSKLCIRNQLHP